MKGNFDMHDMNEISPLQNFNMHDMNAPAFQRRYEGIDMKGNVDMHDVNAPNIIPSYLLLKFHILWKFHINISISISLYHFGNFDMHDMNAPAKFRYA